MTSEDANQTRASLRNNPIFFAEAILNLELFQYQAELLKCTSKRVVACWARQTGKTTTIAIKVIHFAYTNQKTTTLIVSRGLRQSMIMFGIIENLIMKHPILRKSVTKSTRTNIQTHQPKPNHSPQPPYRSQHKVEEGLRRFSPSSSKITSPVKHIAT